MSAKTKTIIKYLSLSCLALVSAFILINQFDQELDPELKAITDKTYPIPPENENAFHAYVGFYAAEGEDIVTMGKYVLDKYAEAILRHKAVTFDAKQVQGTDALELKDDGIRICNDVVSRSYCLATVRKDKVKIERSIQENSVLIARYASLYQYNAFYATSSYLPVTPFSTHNMVLKEIAIKWINGDRDGAVSQLVADITFQRMMGREARVLLHKIIALAGLSQSYRLLHDFINECSACVLSNHRIKTVLADLEEETLLSQRVIEGEIKWAYTTHEEMQKVAASKFDLYNQLMDQEYLGEAPASQLYGLLGYFYLPNATINDYFRRTQKLNMQLSHYKYKEYAKQLVTTQAQMNQLERHWWDYLYNPGGKHLATLDITDPVYSRYFETGFKTGAFIRLARLQLLIKEKNVGKDGIQAFLSNQPRQNNDPYTDEPVQYHQKRNSLFVIPFGLEEETIEVFL